MSYYLVLFIQPKGITVIHKVSETRYKIMCENDNLDIDYENENFSTIQGTKRCFSIGKVSLVVVDVKKNR